jgi:two-component system, response regulator PdtaR
LLKKVEALTGRLGICRSLPQPLIVVIVFGSRRRHKEPVVSLRRTRSEISVSRPNKLQGVSVGCWSALAGLRDAEMIRDRRPLSAAQVCTILLVEDEILVRAMVAEELREAGMRVIEAANAEEAMEHLGAGHAVDVVFTDIEMPGAMNGLDLARRLRVDFPQIKVLITSGRLSSDQAASIRPVFPKPYDIVDLLEYIRQALSGSEPE